jgi:L-fucose isomerase-like protein
MKSFVEQRRAAAVSAICGPFIRDADKPVPCVALTLFQDRGIPAACQGDIDALLTMILFKRVSGQPGFMGGPIEDGGYLAVSHCVMSRQMRGTNAVQQPYYFGDYHGRKTSPTIHTDLPTGEVVTVARLTQNLESLILTAGVVVDSRDVPGRCRNSLVIQVSDLPQLLSMVKGVQYHLVVAAGDYTGQLADLAERLGIEVAHFS